MAEKIKYWTPYKLLAIRDASYYLAIGERSNGKTYGTLTYGLERYFETGEEFAYIRRWDDDLKGEKGNSLFNGHIRNGVIEKLSKGKYNSIVYRSRSWYLCYVDEEGNRSNMTDTPFCYGFALTTAEHYKSTSYPNIKTIIFDEFLTRKAYLPDEFIIFQNLLSTIIRLKDDVKIFMLGNTVNKYSPYFSEMGLKHIKDQEKGKIDVYEYGESGLKVAVEYTDFDSSKKKSNKYFAFDNPQLQMITSGKWEISIYPHYPENIEKPRPKEISYKFYIIFQGVTLQANVITKSDRQFLFIHRKTSPIKEDNKYIVYQEESNSLPNYRRKITRPITQLEKKIVRFFAMDKVFYSDNEVGEVVRNYLIWCKTAID